MPPLMPAGLFIVMLSVAAAAATFYAARRSWRTGISIALAATGGLLVNAVVLQDSLRVAQVLVFQDVIVLGNPMLPLASMLAAAAFALLSSPAWQRSLLAVSVVGVASWRTVAPMVRPAPKLGESRWSDGVCRQSTLATCSPAAAATALHDVGIDATEAALARLCLTSIDGTSNLGLYRGLRCKTDGTAVRVIPVILTAVDARHQGLRRCIFSITSSSTSTFELAGKHSVVLFGFHADGSAEIGDPFSGRQRWTVEQFNALWSGSGFALSTEPADR